MTRILDKIHTVLFAMLFATATAFYYLHSIDANTLLGLLVSIGTIYYGSLKLRMENDSFFKDLFHSFNDRYDKEMNDLINELRTDQNKVLNITEKNKIIDYFNLCAEEFLWKSKQRIPNDVWKAWRAGIMDNLAVCHIK
jgi:hypothetical protein